MKRVAGVIVHCLLLLTPGFAEAAPRTKAAPAFGDFLYGIASGPAGSLEYAVAGRLSALAALAMEGGPHGESGPRFVPLVERSAGQALSDLLSQPSTDAAILPAPLLERAARRDPGIKAQVGYVSPLYLERVHVLAKSDVRSLADLAGRRVAIDGPDGVGAALFEDLGVAVTPVLSTPDDPVAAVRDGRVAAVVIVGGDPVANLETVTADAGLRLLPVPYGPALEHEFVPASLPHAGFPGLVPAEGVATVAAPAVLAVYLRSARSERAQTLWSLVLGVLANADSRGSDAAGRALGDVNWAAEVPGWHRLDVVTRWLDAKRRAASTPFPPPTQKAPP